MLLPCREAGDCRRQLHGQIADRDPEKRDQHQREHRQNAEGPCCRAQQLRALQHGLGRIGRNTAYDRDRGRQRRFCRVYCRIVAAAGQQTRQGQIRREHIHHTLQEHGYAPAHEPPDACELPAGQRAFGCGKANERIYERHEQTADKRDKQAEKQRRGHIQRSCARQRPGCSSRAAHYRKQQLGIRLHFIQHRGCQTEHTFHIGCEQQRDSQRSCHGLNMQPVVRDALAHKLADERSRQQQRRHFYHSKKVTPAVIEFVDIAGLVKGASKGEGLGNQFLANIREVDAIVHVVRCFEDSNVIHVDGSIDPIRDIETINLELIFSDLEILERRIAKVTKTARMDKEAAKELDFLQKVKTHLEDGKMAITMEMENEDEEAWMSTYNLLTWKPVIYAANVAEGDLADDGESNSHVQAVRKYAAEQNSEIFVICAEIEEEISELDDDEKKMFLEDLGLTESGLEKLVKASYHLLGLMSFLTSGEDETRAWTIKIGTKAPQAAGKIHTDFERGFIKAEVVNYQDLLDCGSYAGAREKGLVRMEGKEYVVQDGDVILFRFNV